ncbi:helix-turn-helix domain-containing protein [Arthrobacter sp. PsM3]|uniref:helix-turn-helix domain-containing protein n=1 Tax=Arthrobacter sp. PsM3 TaxID=3030531 RepID=UPI00263B969B|nr:PucR family transcriptional regulator [Arthrobacter sp. PsM3]MDN4645106.1 helix-turn-helix domain-containing protein [Arthrobacter sp. PsM3]
MPDKPAVTLNDVVSEALLGLVPVVPGSPAAVITGAHTSDIDNPAAWLEPNTVLLTTGLRFVNAEGDEQLAVRLVDDLRKARVAAVFFGVGVYFDQVPAKLVSACKQAGLPLYTVAPDVPFHRIENFINKSQASPDAYLQKRALWLSNDLLQSISAENPVKALIVRLAAACRGTAVLYEDSGKIVESSGDGPTHLIWRELRNRKNESDPVVIGQWGVMARSLVLRGDGFTVAVASRNHRVLTDLGDVLLETTQRLLAAVHGIAQFSDSRERHENTQLLTMLQDGVPVAREFRHWERMRTFRFVPYAPIRALVAANLTQQPLGQSLSERLLRGAEISGLGLLLAENGRTPESPPGFHAVVSDSSALDAWLELTETAVFIGLSEPYTDLAKTPDAFREAEAAAGIARRQIQAAMTTASGAYRGIVRLDEVDPATWLLGHRQTPQDRDKLNRFVAALNVDGELKQTVICYLVNDLDVAKVAGVLFVHPNTVRYRLKKAETLVGGSLSSPRIIANLYLAFHDEIVALGQTTPESRGS